MRIIAARSHPSGTMMTMIAKWVFPWNAKKAVRKMSAALDIWAQTEPKDVKETHQSSPS